MSNQESFIRNGYVCYFAKNAKILNYLDQQFKNWALAMGAEEYFIPALIDKEVLDKCGYLTTFPQHITAVCGIEPISEPSPASGWFSRGDADEVGAKFLTPAACLHIYPMFEGKALSGNKIVTTLARVYRRENGRYQGAIRLWDFTVREIVFIGSKDFVADKLNCVKSQAKSFLEGFGIACRLATTSDHFYPTKENLVRARLQKANSLKSELVAEINQTPVSLCSVNSHGTHFSKAFNFDNDGEIVTGCVGFGLDRWVSLFNAHGVAI